MKGKATKPVSPYRWATSANARRPSVWCRRISSGSPGRRGSISPGRRGTFTITRRGHRWSSFSKVRSCGVSPREGAGGGGAAGTSCDGASQLRGSAHERLRPGGILGCERSAERRAVRGSFSKAEWAARAVATAMAYQRIAQSLRRARLLILGAGFFCSCAAFVRGRFAAEVVEHSFRRRKETRKVLDHRFPQNPVIHQIITVRENVAQARGPFPIVLRISARAVRRAVA